MNVISSTHFHIMWNGAPLPAIVPSRGIVSEGSFISLSIYLERLSILLEEAVQDKTIHPVTFRGQIKMSHLFFADDIFLYSKVNITECHNLENILHKFYNCSGQIIST